MDAMGRRVLWRLNFNSEAMFADDRFVAALYELRVKTPRSSSAAELLSVPATYSIMMYVASLPLV
jgi:hypothetical protein